MTEIVRDVSPESLARANEANLTRGMAACARAYGGEVAEEPDLMWCTTGIPAASFNRVSWAMLATGTLDARIEWVQGRARALGVPMVWDIGPSSGPAELGEHLVRHGFSEIEGEPAMGIALAALPDTLPLPDGVMVERAQDRAALEVWVRTMRASFGMPESADAPLLAGMARDTFGDEAAAHYYIARLDGEPVACAALTCGGGVAGLFSVATMEAARRRGIGTAVTMAPLLDARERGYYVGVLQASEMGYPVYARMGFTEQFRYHSFRWRPA